METPKAKDVKKGISLLWETLQCPICLDLMTAPVSTKCDHQFCKFCMMKLLDNTKQNKANCPVCKAKITKRSLQESPGFQRLVTGLKGMILAYENDTGTNYLTGMPQQKEQLEVTDMEAAKHEISSGDSPGTDHDSEEHVSSDLPKSHSSTIAAQNGFARLMGLEDTSPLTAENSGLDSGLGEAPPTFNKKINSPTNFEGTEIMEKSSTRKKVKTGASKLQEDGPDGTKQQPSRMSLRKRHKRDLEPDVILNQKQKKSLEKVAEWLMKVPSDGQFEKPNEDADDSDSCSSNSTIDIGQQNNYVNPTREDPVKTLEDQVFGAIYRRERKGNRMASPPPNVFGKPVKAKTIELDTVSPADFVKKATFEDKSASDMEEEQQIIEELTNLPENDKNDCRVEVPCPVSDVGQQQAETKRKKRKQITLQQVDSDLLDQAKAKSESTEQKQNNKKRSKNTVSEKNKPARVTKPLLLVTVENGETSPKTRLRPDEVKVHIENYPSSEDQEVPLARSARRGRRLKVFTEEVQGCQKKVNSKASIPEKDHNVSKQCADSEGGILDNSTSPKNKNTTKRPERNGCICHQDFGGVEIESGEKASSLRPEKDAKNSTSELPNAEILSEVPVVPNSTSPPEIALKEPTLEGDNPNSNTQNCAQVETECTGIRNEEDSQQNTEQLVRSFKATKRRSFHLGGAPNTKKICSSDQENVECAAAEENQYVCSSVAKEQKHTTIPEINQEALGNSENKSCDLISPSNSPNLTRKAVVEKPHQVVVEALIPDSCSGQEGSVGNPVVWNCVGSPLTPNKVSERELESPCLSFIPKLGESGLLFTDVERNEPNITSKYSQITENQPDCAAREDFGDSISVRSSRGNHSANAAEQILNEESSLTPDGLVMPVTQTVHEAKSSTHGSGELSTHSSIKGMYRKKKKKRAKRLKSSSDLSDCAGEELPTLNEILGMAAPPSSVSQNLRYSSDANRCERVTAVRGEPLSRPPACPSPDCVHSSQASMDLFGTPEECDAAVNDPSVSVESSQFSSEVLVTQQKIEMQKELVRLEKLMALVSEVLQEKEAPPKTDQNSQITGPDTHRPLLHGQDTASDGKTVTEAECEANTRPSDNSGITQHAVSKHGSIAEIGASVKDTGASKTLSSNSAVKMLKSNGSPSDGQEDKENNTPTRDRSKLKMVLVSSGLGPNEQITVKKFARRVGARVVSQVTPEVTHVIMSTDEQLVCERTLKYFLGIAGRKWVMSFQWISECFKQKKLLNESSFEVKGDVVNGSNHQGPMRARKTEDDNLLMKDYKICFQGPFTDMTTDEMEWMVELCGAAVFKDPLLLDSKQKSHQLVIVQPGSESTSAYSSLSRRATVVTRGWLLDTVSTYTIQNFSKYAAAPRVP